MGKRKREGSNGSDGSSLDGSAPSELFQVLKCAIDKLQREVEASKRRQKETDEKLKVVGENSEEHAKLLKQLRPLRKKYVRKHSLGLVNELIGFVSQIHGSGITRKFDKSYEPGKFNKLVEQTDFQNDFAEYLKVAGADQTVNSALDLRGLFTSITKKRNGDVHFREPEDCVKEILKFKRKHSDMLVKCELEVKYCFQKLSSIMQQFIGGHRLQRLASQFIIRLGIALGGSWTTLGGFQTFLKGCHQFNTNINKPSSMRVGLFHKRIVEMLRASQSHGPSWKVKDEDGDNYEEIKDTFKTCVTIGLLPDAAGATQEKAHEVAGAAGDKANQAGNVAGEKWERAKQSSSDAQKLPPTGPGRPGMALPVRCNKQGTHLDMQSRV